MCQLAAEHVALPQELVVLRQKHMPGPGLLIRFSFLVKRRIARGKGAICLRSPQG